MSNPSPGEADRGQARFAGGHPAGRHREGAAGLLSYFFAYERTALRRCARARQQAAFVVKRSWLVGAVCTSALLGTGCPPPAAGRAPATRQEALERVNSNLREVNRPVTCNALVSIRFRDDRGRQHSILAHQARLIFQPPQSMLFDVRSLAGTVAQMGSDAQHYYIWVDVPQLRKLWWGEWASARTAGDDRLAIPPEDVLDALMLRPLVDAGATSWLLRVERDDHRLISMRDQAGTAGWREIRLDPRPPYLPVEITDRAADGQVLMHATVSDYRRIGEDGPLTPRRYIVQWPDRESPGQLRAELRLDVHSAKFREPLPDEAFARPQTWRGETQQIGAGAGGSGTP